jgi:hypothetical protein
VVQTSSERGITKMQVRTSLLKSVFLVEDYKILFPGIIKSILALSLSLLIS